MELEDVGCHGFTEDGGAGDRSLRLISGGCLLSSAVRLG